jgi:hypothetical protein
MNPIDSHTGNHKRIRFAAAIVFAEVLLMMFSGVSFSQLNGASFFSFEADPLYWIIFGLKNSADNYSAPMDRRYCRYTRTCFTPLISTQSRQQ